MDAAGSPRHHEHAANGADPAIDELSSRRAGHEIGRARALVEADGPAPPSTVSPVLAPGVVKAVGEMASEQRARLRPLPTNEIRRGRRPVHRSADGMRQALVGLLLIPGMVWWAASWGLQVLADLARRAHGEDPRRPLLFRRPTAMPRERAHRSVADIVGQLEQFPFDPIPQSARTSFMRYFGADGLSTLLVSTPDLSSLPHTYPPEFQHVLLTGADDVRLGGLQAMHSTSGPALVIAHGLMTNKNFDYIRRMAIRAYRWGFHVVVLDQRGWGTSSWTTDAPPSGGYMEGKDIVAIARALRRDSRVTSVGALGYSMGAGACLNAAHEASLDGDGVLDGGVLALSAPTDVGEAIDFVSRRPSMKSPFFPLYVMFNISLRRALPRRGIDLTRADWREIMRATSLPHYRVNEDEFNRRASAVEWADEITVPTLELHAEDDFMVPVSHAYQLREAAAGNENVHVMIVDKGNHVSFGAVDQRWFHSIVRRWFEYWAEEGEG